MAILAKIDPFQSWLENDVVNFEAPIYRNAVPRIGDEIFIWLSETSGGQGFDAIGIISETYQIDGVRQNVECRISCIGSRPQLTKTDLVPFRDAERTGPLEKLSDVLYRHSLNKIVEIDEDTARYLRVFSSKR